MTYKLIKTLSIETGKGSYSAGNIGDIFEPGVRTNELVELVNRRDHKCIPVTHAELGEYFAEV